MSTFVDDLLPIYDVSDGVATVVDADADTTWRALLDADLVELGRRRPLVGALGALRMLPEMIVHLVRGEPLPAAPEQLTLEGTADPEAGPGSWVLLRKDDGSREIALGLVGRFWRPVIRWAQVPAERFAAFDEPGWAKTVYALWVTPLDDGRSLVSAVMRTATTDDLARRRFRAYWTLGVGSGAHLLVESLLDEVRRIAETAAPAVT